jgi:hypothetical protein
VNTIQQSTAELGQLVSSHNLKFSKKWGLVSLGVLLICLGPAAYLWLSSLWAGAGVGMQETLESTPVLGYSPLIAGIIFPLMGLYGLFGAWSHWHLAVNVYEHGLEYTDRRGTRQVLWKDVKNLHQHIVRHYYYMVIPAGTDYSVTLTLQGGEVLSFDNRLGKTKKLGQILQERLAEAHLPHYMAEIQAGKRVEFGTLSLDREGVYQQDKALKWDEVEKVTFNHKTLSIGKKGSKWGSWASVKTHEIPNAALFYAITRELGVTG